ENMAEAVWATMELYGLVIAIVMDNASNNNMLMTSLEGWCEEWGISFSAQDACMHCMPHTVHLAAIKLLKGIDAISKANGRKAATRGSNYQDIVTIPLTCEHNSALADNEPDGDGVVGMDLDIDVEIKFKQLWKIIKSVCSSPQRRQSWACEILFVQGSGSSDDCSVPLMLILDVRT
ncbi:hypothetical protein BYT27DRAFT_7022995, partial [Phlegmacium glaucopus]